MSRIQDILSKAERDGTARRTRTIVDEYAARPAEPPVAARARTTGDEPRPAVDAPQQNRSPESWSRPAAVEPARPAPTLGDAARLTRPARQVSPVAPEPRIRFTEPTVTPEPGALQPGTTTVEPARVLPELDQHLVAA